MKKLRENNNLFVLTGQEEEQDDPYSWEGMPEYVQEDMMPEYVIKVNFDTLEDLKEFSNLIGVNLTEKTRSISFPPKEREANKIWQWIETEKE